MREFDGSLRMPGERGPGLGVVIDLESERLRVSAGGVEIGDWPLDQIRIAAHDDGFHVRAEGDEIILVMPEPQTAAEFAVALGLTSAPPDIRRRMSAIVRRSGVGVDAES
jgi:hypothetical protein